jgi:subtilisin family serine protease
MAMASRSKTYRAVSRVILPLLWIIMIGHAVAQDAVNQQAIVRIGAGKSVQQAIEAIDGTVIDTIPGKPIYLVSFPEALNLTEALTALNANPDVDTSQANHIVEFTEINQVDQVIPDQSAPPLLQGTSPASYYGHAGYDAIRADSAHRISTGEDVFVAFIDNGIDFDHPLFESAIGNYGYDFVDNDTLPAEDSGLYYGHGTFVAGIILRVAPDCKLIPYRAFDEDGRGTVFNITKAVYRAIDDSARILNMSFSVLADNAILRDAIDAASNADIAMVAAPGNDSSYVAVYPAGYNDVIAVSAIDSMDVISDFSNYGQLIDICAPGENIYSSLAGYYQWGTWSGTSFSAPMAAGASALILSLEKNLTSSRVEQVLMGTAETELQWGTVVPDDSLYGYGCLDALEAVSEFNKGDVDFSGEINNTDKSYLEEYLYLYGPAPVPLPKVGDLDCSGEVNLTDYMILINYLESGGPRPTPCE